MKNTLNFLIVSTYIFVYFLPLRGFIYDTVIFIYYGILIICSLIISFNNFKMNLKSYYVFIFFILFITYRFFTMGDIESLNIMFTIYIALFITSHEYEISNKIAKLLTYLSFISIILQMMFFRNLGRPVLSIIDPNYSGFYIFLVFVSLDKMNSKFKYLSIILGFLTFSRVFILALLLYHLFKSKRIISFVYKVKFSSFHSLSIVSCIALMLFSCYFVNNVTIVAEQYSISRLYKLNDPSNMSRFVANIRFFKALHDDKKFLLLGEKDIEIYKKKFYKNIPHNNFFEGIRRYGLPLYILMFFLINKAFNRVISQNNINIVFATFSYYAFLGGLANGYKLLLTLIILKFTYNKNSILANKSKEKTG